MRREGGGGLTSESLLLVPGVTCADVSRDQVSAPDHPILAIVSRGGAYTDTALTIPGLRKIF